MCTSASVFNELVWGWITYLFLQLLEVCSKCNIKLIFYFNDPVSKIYFLLNTQFQNPLFQSLYIITFICETGAWENWQNTSIYSLLYLQQLFIIRSRFDLKPKVSTILLTLGYSRGIWKWSKKRWEHGESFRDSLNVSFI